jgi:transmembrane sensor
VALEINDIDDLIGKVLSGEAEAEEVRRVDSWRNETIENQKYFDDMKVIFARASSNVVKVDFDTDAAWTRLKSRLVQKSGVKVVPLETKKKAIQWPALRIAAGIVLIITTSLFAWKWYSDSPGSIVQVTSDTKVVQDTLPDGSTAFLNKQSSITYEYDARARTRKVKLKGEGFFDVRHEETKPFVIETDETLVRDIGTSFNVKSYPDKDTIEVIVTTGIVQFYTLNDPGLMISEGESGIYSKRNKTFTKMSKADTNVLAYKTRVFSFHSTDLQSVINQINDVYDSHIVLANAEIANCQLTATFRDDELDTVVEVIAESLALTVERNDKNEIILNGRCR